MKTFKFNLSEKLFNHLLNKYEQKSAVTHSYSFWDTQNNDLLNRRLILKLVDSENDQISYQLFKLNNNKLIKISESQNKIQNKLQLIKLNNNKFIPTKFGLIPKVLILVNKIEFVVNEDCELVVELLIVGLNERLICGYLKYDNMCKIFDNIFLSFENEFDVFFAKDNLINLVNIKTIL